MYTHAQSASLHSAFGAWCAREQAAIIVFSTFTENCFISIPLSLLTSFFAYQGPDG